MRYPTTAILAALLASLIAPAAYPQSAGYATVNRGTISLTAAEWPTIIAQRKGLFERERLKVEQAIISPTTIASSLIGGSIDVGFIGATQLLVAVEAGANIVAIGQGMDPAPYSLMVAPSVKTFADLKGKTIALAAPGEIYTEVVKVIFRKAGLDPEKDVNYFYGSNSNQRMSALLGGAAHAGLLVPPQDRTLAGHGFHALAFTPDYYPNLALSLTAVRRDWAQKNADVLRRYMKAQSDAIRWLYDAANRNEAMQLLMKETNSDLAAGNASYDLYVTKMRIFPVDGCIQTKGLAASLELMRKLGQVKTNPPVEKFIDTQWCPK
ncbi:MAG: ABC transporter substrate-binding protein [Betaproteobacteria bacterium]|nr:ABC transporter substrate-binding protein [Betaproteobacteria bacterium]